MKKAEKLALAMASMIDYISKIFAPIVWLLTCSSNLTLKLLGIDPNVENEEVTEEEIRMLVDVGTKKGIINTQEQEIIQNIFEFDDLAVGEFSTHRKEIILLWLQDSDEIWEQTIHESRHSLYPICDETVDNIVGVLSVKEYFRLKDKSRKNVMKYAVSAAYFVPQSIKADILFKQMKKTFNHFAVVVDEYGGTYGIVTMNDLLEQIVGDLNIERGLSNSPLDIEQIEHQVWRIYGYTPLEDVAKMLNVILPIDEYDTFGGFVLGTYGWIPNDGSKFEIDTHGLHIQVTEIREHCMEVAIVSKKDMEE